MSGDLEIDLPSWPKLGDLLAKDGGESVRLLDQVVAETTNPAACGAAEGLAGVDGAVSIMLTVFDEVMRSDFLPALAEGFDIESRGVVGTGMMFADMDDEAAQAASQAFGAS